MTDVTKTCKWGKICASGRNSCGGGAGGGVGGGSVGAGVVAAVRAAAVFQELAWTKSSPVLVSLKANSHIMDRTGTVLDCAVLLKIQIVSFIFKLHTQDRTLVVPTPYRHGPLWKTLVEAVVQYQSSAVRVNWNMAVCWRFVDSRNLPRRFGFFRLPRGLPQLLLSNTVQSHSSPQCENERDTTQSWFSPVCVN
jgi:hypothetical protein